MYRHELQKGIRNIYIHNYGECCGIHPDLTLGVKDLPPFPIARVLLADRLYFDILGELLQSKRIALTKFSLLSWGSLHPMIGQQVTITVWFPHPNFWWLRMVSPASNLTWGCQKPVLRLHLTLASPLPNPFLPFSSVGGSPSGTI